MIQPLRQRHRVITTALAFVLPVLFVAGLVVRRQFPSAGQLQKIRQTDPLLENISVGHQELGKGSGIAMYLGSNHSNKEFLELVPSRDPAEPDLLVYWSESEPSSERLPEAAVLLGAMAGSQPKSFPLPEQASANKGRIILYSLAHQKVITTADLSTIGVSGKGAAR
ncbi:MAG TPA: hypothetical protein VFD58_09570 [Blastocatellia bacterium]|nr:hypothetical protein [Blastocatellia bacterium]